MSSLFSAAGPSCPPAPNAAVTRAGPPPSARRGIYAHPLPAASALFHIRSVAEPSWSPDDGGVYEPKPFVYIAWRSLLIGTGLGLFSATFQNAYYNRGQHWLPIFTQYGRTIGLCASVVPAFAGTRALVANIRQKNHWSNSAAGGCAAGFLIGLRGGRIVPAFAGSMIGAVAMGFYEYAVPPSGKLLANEHENALERYERLEKRYLQRKRWADIHPPPGQGYGPDAYPGYTKNYTENGVY